jgi:hypothetical protein
MGLSCIDTGVQQVNQCLNDSNESILHYILHEITSQPQSLDYAHIQHSQSTILRLSCSLHLFQLGTSSLPFFSSLDLLVRGKCILQSGHVLRFGGQGETHDQIIKFLNGSRETVLRSGNHH